MARRTLYAFFASMPFALILFALVAAVSSIGSLHPALGPAVYRSWWFFGLLFLLVLNTGLCAWNRRAWLLRGCLRRRVVWVLHVSVVVVAAACSWAAASFRMEQVAVRRGAEFRVGAETWTLREVEVRRYPDGSVSDWISRVQTPAGPKEIKVNHPAVSGGLKVLQSGFQQIYRVAIESGGRMERIELVQDVEVPLSADGLIGFAVSPPRDGLPAKVQAESGAMPFAELLLTSRGRILQRTSLFVGIPLALGDSGLGLTVLEADQESVFLLRSAPGLPFVWVGFALLAASIAVLALIPRPGAPKEKKSDD
jgi:hypothetical protein